MPTIGKRIIKSTLAAYICFCIFILRGEPGTPFYSAIAAVLCMQPNVSNSKSAAVTRVIGTLIGAFWGTIFLFFQKSLLPSFISPYLSYAFISLGILIVIYVTVLLKQTPASYMSVVVFLSIVIAHSGDSNALIFSFNRMLDTLIGIFVALILTYIPYLLRKGKNVLYVIDMDQIQLHSQTDLFDSNSAVKLNMLLERGAHILFTTKVSSCSFMPHLSNLNLNLPVICLNGTAVYDTENTTYVESASMSSQDTKTILDTLDALSVNYFTATLNHDFLHIYYKELTNPVEKSILDSVSAKYQRHYICNNVPAKTRALTITVVQPKELIREILLQIEMLECSSNLKLTTYPANDFEEYYYLDIYEKEVSIENTTKAFAEKYMLRDIEQIPFIDSESAIRTIEHHFYNHFHFLS
jgi:hydroxymethylpyrimidine pyrophosphatase-like HAD family hydrolase